MAGIGWGVEVRVRTQAIDYDDEGNFVWLTEEYAHALWGIESDADPSYIVEVANNLLRDIDWDRLWADLAAENLCHSA